MNPDLLTWLLDAYVKDQPAMDALALQQLNSFKDFAKKKLQENPPTSVYMAAQGLGLKFSDGTEIPLLPQPATDMGTNDAYMPITNKNGSDPTMRAMADKNTVHVFGGK